MKCPYSIQNITHVTRDATLSVSAPARFGIASRRAVPVVLAAWGVPVDVHSAIRRAGGDPNQLAGTGKGSGRLYACGRDAKVAISSNPRIARCRRSNSRRCAGCRRSSCMRRTAASVRRTLIRQGTFNFRPRRPDALGFRWLRRLLSAATKLFVLGNVERVPPPKCGSADWIDLNI